MLAGTSRVNSTGHLEIGNCDTLNLVREFGTPLICYDEALIRANCRTYINSFKRRENRVAYAGKAFLSIAMCQIIDEEGLYLDVVSGGELYTALKAGFPVERIYFHGNNKTADELQQALYAQVGCFVIDNRHEYELLRQLVLTAKYRPVILLRVALGVDAATHKYIQTGQHDSKFGFAINSGELDRTVEDLTKDTVMNFLGFHSHIGSQITTLGGFRQAVGIMFDLVNDYKLKYQWVPSELSLGGGLGIAYTLSEEANTIEELTSLVLTAAEEQMERVQVYPRLVLEPGRSIVGQAGTTLYTTGAIKQIAGVRNYVAVDGGMTDNPRPALYQAQYQCALAGRMLEQNEETYSIAGKCCESGDMLIWNHELPRVQCDEVLAVFYTGAYNYSMASNYNRIPRPAVVLVKDGNARLIIQRESYEDIIKLDKSLS
ncbi:MAG: diaminopimelate decarboxylase [Peptococcaceae bacterium]|nr:diaminopimelate decarboxylase [Peptococcaceae bacterium]